VHKVRAPRMGIIHLIPSPPTCRPEQTSLYVRPLAPNWFAFSRCRPRWISP